MVWKRINKNKNFWVIAYDVTDNLRRSRISKVIEKFGVRVNYSIFECMLTDKQFENLKDKLSKIMLPSKDHIIYYPLCIDCYSKIIHSPDRYKKPYVITII